MGLWMTVSGFRVMIFARVLNVVRNLGERLRPKPLIPQIMGLNYSGDRHGNYPRNSL